MVSLPGLPNLYSATQPKKTMINYMSHAPDNVYTELYPLSGNGARRRRKTLTSEDFHRFNISPFVGTRRGILSQIDPIFL